MDKTVYTGINADACILIKPDSKWIHGDPEEVCDMLSSALTDAIAENPHMRRSVLKAARRVWKDTLPEVFAYWLEGWPLTVAGVIVLTVMVYGLGWLGHVLGAC